MSIASEITRLQGVKADILTAIADKGVLVPAGSALDDCPGLIANISAGLPGIYLLDAIPDSSLGVDGEFAIVETSIYGDLGNIIPPQSSNANCNASNQGHGAAYQAVDNNLTTYWSTSDNYTSGWWRYDFGSMGAVITSLSIYPRVWNNMRQINSFYFVASNDNVSWTTLLASSIPLGNAEEWFGFKFPNTNSYRYYQLNVLTTNGQTVTVYEIHMNDVDVSSQIKFIGTSVYKKVSGSWILQ